MTVKLAPNVATVFFFKTEPSKLLLEALIRNRFKTNIGKDLDCFK